MCIQSCANSWPSARDCAISFSWCGKTRSSPPPWISKTGPSSSSAITEHSMCQPGRPRPHGESHHVSSPCLFAFQSAKSRGSSLRGVRLLVAPRLLAAAGGRRACRSRGSSRRGSRRRRRPRTRAPRAISSSITATISGTISVAFGSTSGRPRPRSPVSSRYQPRRVARRARALAPGRGLVDLVVDVRDVVDERRRRSPLRAASARSHMPRSRTAARCRCGRARRRSGRRSTSGSARAAAAAPASRRGERVIEPHRPSAAPRRAVERGDDRPQLGPALAPGQREPQRPQVAADRLQLAEQLLRVGARRSRARAARGTARASAARPRQRPPSPARGSERGVLARLVQVARAAQRRRELDRRPDAGGELLVVQARRSPRPPGAGSAPGRSGRRVAAGRARRGSARTASAGIPASRSDATVAPSARFESFLPSCAEDQPVVDVLRRLGAERLEQPPVQRLVRPVVVPADHVRDRRSRCRRRRSRGGRSACRPRATSVVPSKRSPSVGAASRCRSRRSLWRTGPSSHSTPSHSRSSEDRLLAAGHVPRRVGVVDPQQQPVAERAVRDGAERVADVQRPGRAGREAGPDHPPKATRFAEPFPSPNSALARASPARNHARARTRVT